MLTSTHTIPSARRVVWVSFLVDLSDIILNLLIAFISGSVVMISQALQGMADLTTSGLLLIGVRRSSRRANRAYQFGHGREVFFWVLAASIMMFLSTGAAAFWLGLQRFLNPEPIHHEGLAIIVLLIGLLTNLYALNLSFQRLRKSSPHGFWHHLLNGGMIETKATLLLDLMGSAAAVFGLVAMTSLIIFNNDKLDGVGAMITGLATASLALFLFKDAKDLLVGKAAPREVMAEIKQAALEIKGVTAVLDLRTMYLGSAQLLVNIEVALEPQLHTRPIERIMDQIKKQIKSAVPSVRHIQVELETPPH